MPQAFSDDQAAVRVTKACAATYSAQRTSGSPALEMRPGLSVSPDWDRLGVRPEWAAAVREDLKRCGSSTAVLYVSAVTAPTPGTVISRWHTGSTRTTALTSLSS